MINCAIYPRKSKANDSSQSMDQQIFDCKRYIKDHYTDAKIYLYDADYGITGHSISKRKDFQRLMEDIKKGKIQLVVIMRYDRIARNMRDFCNIYYEMESNGCNLVSVSQQIDTTTPYGKNFMYQIASMAELEWALTSERYKDMHKYKINHGYAYTGKLPHFGFKIEIVEGKKLIVHDREEETRDIFEHLLKYKSKNGTVKYVRDNYEPNFTRRMLDAMIKSDLYIGKVRENESYCEPYFTAAYMEEVRSLNQIKRTPTGNTYLFTGLITCPLCGLKMAANINSRKGKLYIYYRCPGSIRSKHGHIAVAETVIENALINNLKAYLDDFNSNVINVSSDNKKSLKSQINKLTDAMSRIDHLFELGRMDIQEYDKKILAYKKELKQLEQKKQTQIIKADSIVTDDWLTIYNKLNKENKRTWWQNIIKEIKINELCEVDSIFFI